MGSTTSSDGSINDEIIADDLRCKKRKRGAIKVGDVIETTIGALYKRDVKRLIHVATVKARAHGDGLEAELDSISSCVTAVLDYTAASSGKWHTSRWLYLPSILIPLMGSGDGKLPVSDVALKIVSACKNFFVTHPTKDPDTIYLIAYSDRELAAIRAAIEAVGGFQADLG